MRKLHSQITREKETRHLASFNLWLFYAYIFVRQTARYWGFKIAFGFVSGVFLHFSLFIISGSMLGCYISLAQPWSCYYCKVSMEHVLCFFFYDK